MHGNFRMTEQGSGILAVQLPDSHPCTDLAFIGFPAHLNRPLTRFYDRGYPGFDTLGRGSASLSNQQPEYITSQPGHMAMIGDVTCDPPGYLLQHTVTGVMAGQAVKRLEIIQPKNQNGFFARGIMAGLIKVAVQLLLEETAVGKAGQLIV